jgi:hypothetical protein
MLARGGMNADHLLLWIHNKGCSAGTAEEEEGTEHQDARSRGSS